MSENNRRIAVLIDGDNAEAQIAGEIMNEAAKHGRVTVKRVFGDFTSSQMNGWKQQLNSHAIRPIQKFAYTKGKNSTDSALIIDAMDILHGKLVDGFCLVSSDSDYTGLVHRIREEGLFVMGIGKSHTPDAFAKACEVFVYTEILTNKPDGRRKAGSSGPPPKSAPKTDKLPPKNAKGKQPQPQPAPEPVIYSAPPRQPSPAQPTSTGGLHHVVTGEPISLAMIDDAFDMVADDSDAVIHAGSLGPALKKVDPTFDMRNYGVKSFRQFLEALYPYYELEIRDDKVGQTIFVKRGRS